MVNVKIQRASPTATFPTYGSGGAACMDLYADTKSMQESTMDGVVWIEPHTTVKIPTGFAFQPPEGYCGLILLEVVWPQNLDYALLIVSEFAIMITLAFIQSLFITIQMSHRLFIMEIELLN